MSIMNGTAGNTVTPSRRMRSSVPRRWNSGATTSVAPERRVASRPLPSPCAWNSGTTASTASSGPRATEAAKLSASATRWRWRRVIALRRPGRARREPVQHRLISERAAERRRAPGGDGAVERRDRRRGPTSGLPVERRLHRGPTGEIGDDRDDVGVGEGRPQLGRRVRRVQRYGDGAEVREGQELHDERRAVGQDDPHGRVGRDAGPHQDVRLVAHARGQLVPGDPPVAAHDGGPVAVRSDRPVEQGDEVRRRRRPRHTPPRWRT